MAAEDEEVLSDVLKGIDGAPLDLAALSAALAALAPDTRQSVASASVVAGTENKFPTSHSAVLRLATAEGAASSDVFLKRVTASAMAHKPWADRQRTLKYIRTELRFYAEFAPLLRERGVPLPRVAHLQGQLEALGDDEVGDPAREEPSPEALSRCGALLFLEPISLAAYDQASPLAPERALVALAAAARLHAAAWEDAELLTKAASRLQRNGGAYSLSIRNPKELTKLQPNWAKFVETWSGHAPELLGQPRIVALGERLEKWSGWVAKQLSAGAADSCATLVHGDFKAMNVFLPLPADGADGEAGAVAQQAMLIDFASTGVGYGMADVAMHLTHAILPADLADGGEERLLDGYLDALAEARPEGAAAYPRELALRHYQLGVVDYGRFVVGRFWTNPTAESFAAKADSPNSGLWNRRVDAALAFVERIDRCLAVFELEGVGPGLN